MMINAKLSVLSDQGLSAYLFSGSDLDSFSSPPLFCGVPQGSDLGPVLFVLCLLLPMFSPSCQHLAE